MDDDDYIDPKYENLRWHLRALWSWFKWNHLGGQRRYSKWLATQARGEYQKYFNKKLLEHACELLAVDQFYGTKPKEKTK